MEIGRFRLGAFIGNGASGDVYEGTDMNTGEPLRAPPPTPLHQMLPCTAHCWNQHPPRRLHLPLAPLPPALAGERVAIKCIDCRRFRSILEIQAVQEEIALLSSLRHRFIVRLLGVHLTPSHIHFAMEHAGGGTLDQLRRSKVGRVGWTSGLV